MPSHCPVINDIRWIAKTHALTAIYLSADWLTQMSAGEIKRMHLKLQTVTLTLILEIRGNSQGLGHGWKIRNWTQITASLGWALFWPNSNQFWGSDLAARTSAGQPSDAAWFVLFEYHSTITNFRAIAINALPITGVRHENQTRINVLTKLYNVYLPRISAYPHIDSTRWLRAKRMCCAFTDAKGVRNLGNVFEKLTCSLYGCMVNVPRFSTAFPLFRNMFKLEPVVKVQLYNEKL